MIEFSWGSAIQLELLHLNVKKDSVGEHDNNTPFSMVGTSIPCITASFNSLEVILSIYFPYKLCVTAR